MGPVLEFLKKEWNVLKSAPFSFAGSILVGFLLATWYYSGQIAAVKEQLNTKEGQISRYRVALSIDPPSKGALIELRNDELRPKAVATAAKLRELCASFRNRNERLQSELATSKLGEKEKAKRKFDLLKEESDEFDNTMRTDASLVEIELRRRLSPEAKASIVGLPPAFMASDGGILNMLNITSGSGIDAAFICVLADGIEEMAKLLPADPK